MEVWIKFRKKLLRDGRVLQMSRKCPASRVTLIGALVTLWCLADDYADESGLLVGYTPEDLDREVGVDGFTEALPLDWCEIRDGEVYLPNFHDHNGFAAKKRSQETARKRKQRAKDRDAPQEGVSRSVRDKSVTRQRQDKTKTNNTSSNEEVCAEPDEPDSTPTEAASEELTEFSFPTTGKGPKNWTLSKAKFNEYVESFPGVDVPTELLKARQWCRSNSKKRKTANGMDAFLTRWLSQEQNRGRSPPRDSKPDTRTGPGQKYDPNHEFDPSEW